MELWVWYESYVLHNSDLTLKPTFGCTFKTFHLIRLRNAVILMSCA